MIKVIWSDDIFSDEKEVKASIEFAYSQGVDLIVKQTWDEAQDELTRVGDTYDAIILDGRGQKSIDAKTNDRAHLTKAIGWLSEQKGMGRVFPVIVFTGFYEDIHELYGDDKSIVSIIRKPNINAVYKKIKECVIDVPNTLIKQQYEDVWKIFENKILGAKSEQNLLSLIAKIEDKNVKKEDFNKIRDLFEDLLKKFNDIDNSDNLLPNDVLMANDRINLEWSIRMLMGQNINVKHGNLFVRNIPVNYTPTIPKDHHVGSCFEFVKQISSKLSHSYNNEFGKTLFVACLNALMEIIIWSNKLIIDKYFEKI